MESDNSLDVLGVKPIANSVEKVTDSTMKGTGAFLSRICLPAAEEYGLLLQDKVKNWRANNAMKTMQKAEKKYKERYGDKELKAHPLIAWRIIDNSSWAEYDELQEIWAGLLAATCTEKGEDDSNLIFINILSQLSEIQIKILNFAVKKADIKVHDLDITTAENLEISIELLISELGIEDISRLDRELDHLSGMDLIGNNIVGGGILISSRNNSTNYMVDITPRPLTIQLFVRCQGYIGTPKEYFNL